MQDRFFGPRRYSVRRDFQALVLLCALVPTSLAAQSAATPEGVIEAYYQAVKDGDCVTAMRLRPGYSREACKGISDIPIWNSRVLRENDQRAAMLINVEVLRKGNTKRDTFQGFVTLTRSDEGWRIQTKSYKNATDTFGPGEYLAAHFPSNPVTAITQAPLLETGTPGPSDPIALADLPVPEAEIVTATDDTSGPDQAAEALKVFHAYYDDLDHGDCPHAMTLRPDLKIERCQAVTVVLEATVTVVAQVEGQVALRAKIAYRGLKDDDPEYLTDFRGFLTVSMRQGRWVIDHSSYQPETNNLTQEAFLMAVGMASPAPADPTAEALARRLSNMGSASGIGPELWANSGPRGIGVEFWENGGPQAFGSGSVLASCWSKAELGGNAPEKKTRKTGPGSVMGPPARLVPNVMLTALPVRYRGSIRKVDTGGRKVVALTFDTGEQNNDFAGYDAEIVDYLRKNEIKATFYFGGKWMATHPERALQLIADPLFEAGNHAWTHGNMRVLTGQDAIDQVLFTQAQYELLLEELATRPCVQQAGLQSFQQIPPAIPTFRYPYGTCNQETLKMVNDLGLPAIQWDVVSADPARGQTSDAIAKAILRETKPGSIVIMHANGRGWNTGKALPKFIPRLRELGYEFVTVSELLDYGQASTRDECYEKKPGDNAHYDRLFGRGTGD